MACDQGNAPERTGTNLLEIGTFEHPVGAPPECVVLLSDFWGSPFWHWDHRGRQLIGNPVAGRPAFDLPAFRLEPDPFDPTAPTVCVRYASSHAFWTGFSGPDGANRPLFTQHEVMLFARDPVEQSRLLRGFAKAADLNDSTFPTRWRNEWTPSRVPNAATIVYPPQAGWLTNPLTQPTPGPVPVLVTAVKADAFCPSNVQPTGPGSLPIGTGSIKAIKTIDHGLCATTLDYSNAGGTGLLDVVAQRVPEFAARAVLDRFRCASVIKRFIHVAPYLDFSIDQEQAQVGGFFLNTSLQLDVAFGGGPNLLIHGAHAFDLFDGRLTVAGAQLFSAGAGTSADEARLELTSKLYRVMDVPLKVSAKPQTFAEAVWQEADTAQVFRGTFATQNPSDPTSKTACTQRAPGDDTIVAPSTMSGVCGTFIDRVRNDVDSALKGVGSTANPTATGNIIGLTQDEKLHVNAALNATRVAGNTTVFKNFRCARRESHPFGGGWCEYVMPAKRVNVLPDAVELVFLDATRELSNPVYPIWLHALQLGNTTGLCGAPIAQTPGTTRMRPIREVARDGNRYVCADAARPCQTLSDCAPGQLCAGKVCRGFFGGPSRDCTLGVKVLPWP